MKETHLMKNINGSKKKNQKNCYVEEKKNNLVEEVPFFSRVSIPQLLKLFEPTIKKSSPNIKRKRNQKIRSFSSVYRSMLKNSKCQT